MNKIVMTQMVLAVLRHAMTASPFAALAISDEWMVQTATLIVGLGGMLWSLKRKVPATPAT